MRRTFLIPALCLATALPAAGAGFDCSKAAPDSCEKDSDCICSSVRGCFIGGTRYYDNCVEKTDDCPAYCGGPGFVLVGACVNNACTFERRKIKPAAADMGPEPKSRPLTNEDLLAAVQKKYVSVQNAADRSEKYPAEDRYRPVHGKGGGYLNPATGDRLAPVKLGESDTYSGSFGQAAYLDAHTGVFWLNSWQKGPGYNEDRWFGPFKLIKPAGKERKVKVTVVEDGDTVRLGVGGDQRTVRLYGIDAPELSQPYGDKAKQYLWWWTLGKDVILAEKGKDAAGGTLGVITRDGGLNVNQEMLELGLAWRARNSKDGALAQFEEKARSAKKGLWADDAPVPPWEFRGNK